jgi:hypothetical protein
MTHKPEAFQSLQVYVLKNLDSVAWVRERRIPTERPRLVGEVSANVYALRVLREWTCMSETTIQLFEWPLIEGTLDRTVKLNCVGLNGIPFFFFYSNIY